MRQNFARYSMDEKNLDLLAYVIVPNLGRVRNMKQVGSCLCHRTCTYARFVTRSTGLPVEAVGFDIHVEVQAGLALLAV